MKMFIAIASICLLAGCATRDQLYYDASKSISKDSTVSQAACWAAVGEIAKSGDNAVKVGAIALAEKCKAETIKVDPPKRNMFGFQILNCNPAPELSSITANWGFLLT